MSVKPALQATIVVVAHLAVGVVHDLAHQGLVVELTSFQSIFVQIAYLGLPVVAAVLVWTPFSRLGLGLLAFSLAASLIFGIWYHFLFVSADHVAHLPAGDDQGLFRATAVLMAIVDAVGTWVAVRLLRAPTVAGS